MIDEPIQKNERLKEISFGIESKLLHFKNGICNSNENEKLKINH